MLLVVSFLAFEGVASAEKLRPAMPCELQVEKAASSLIFDLSLELGSKNALSTNEFVGVQASVDALNANLDSSEARACHLQFPQQRRRYQAWLRRQAGEVLGQATRRLNHICTRRTTMFIHSYEVKLEDALEKKRLAKAARLAAQFAKGLQTDEMISRCPATEQQVSELLANYIPAIENQAALPKVLEKLTNTYFASHTTIATSIDALQSSGKDLRAAPLKLESEDGRLRLQADLRHCKEYAAAALDLGATEASLLTSESGDQKTVVDARDFCERVDEQLPELMPRFLAHNKLVHETVLSRWRRVSIKGWGMEKVYNSKGRPLTESSTGGAITWVYRAKEGCVVYRFNPHGKKLGERPVSCPIVGFQGR